MTAKARDWRDRRSAGLDDTTVNALNKLSDALGKVHQARGHLYAFHQLTGSAHQERSRSYR
ncbi:hypothetical protein FLX07_28930 [Microbispora bryophytorum]|nr:hypothetical protein FLX07_28930 [Microbispora bryophytorum]